MRNYLLVCLALVGCSEVTADMPECTSDEMCNNGSHCNLFFRMCEADEYDAQFPEDAGMGVDAYSVVDDGGIESDGQMVAEVDSQVVRTDSGMVSSTDRWLSANHGSMETMPVSFQDSFTVEMWVQFNSRPIVGDVLVSTCDGCFRVDVVDWPTYGLSVSCAYRAWGGTLHRLFIPATSVELGWHHISCTRRTDRTAQMHVDGVMVSSHTTMDLIVPTGLFSIEVANFVGQIDSLRFNSPMRDTAGFVPDVRTAILSADLHYWPMNEGVGNTVSDVVDGSNLLILSDVVWQP